MGLYGSEQSAGICSFVCNYCLMPRKVAELSSRAHSIRSKIYTQCTGHGKTKTGKARHIPLNSIASQALQERKRAQQDYEARQKENGADQTDSAYVFRDAGRDSQHNYRRWFNEASMEAKVANYSWHCNRHTFASRLVMAGVDLRTVAEVMGHICIQMAKRYAHLAPQHSRATVDRLLPVSMSSRSAKKGEESEERGNGVVTKAVTLRKNRLRKQIGQTQ